MAVELMAPAKTPTGSWMGPEVLGNGLAIGQTFVQMLCCPGGSLSCCWWESGLVVLIRGRERDRGNYCCETDLIAVGNVRVGGNDLGCCEKGENGQGQSC